MSGTRRCGRLRPTMPARSGPAGRAGWSGCGTGWIRPGVRASGTARRCCLPATWSQPRTAAWPCRTPRCPTGDAPPVGALRWLPPRPGRRGPVLGAVRRRAAAAGHPAAAARGAARCPAVKVTCTAPACASGMSVPGARTGPSRSRRSSPGHARSPGPANAGSPAATARASPGAVCAASTISGCTGRACWPVTTWRPGSPASGPGSGCTSSPWPGCPNCCAPSCSTHCSSVTRHRRRWTPPRSGSCSARLGGAGSLREADPQAVCESGGTSLQHRDPRAVPRPAPASGPGPGAVLPAPTRSPVTCGRWPARPADQCLPALAGHPGRDRLRRRQRDLAAGDRQGLGPDHPPVSAAAAGDAARLPGRLARPDRSRVHRAGCPGRRGLHPDHRCDQHAAAHRRGLIFRGAPQPDDLPVLPGHRVRPGQRADDRGARPVPPRRPGTGCATTPTRTSWARPCPRR